MRELLEAVAATSADAIGWRELHDRFPDELIAEALDLRYIERDQMHPARDTASSVWGDDPDPFYRLTPAGAEATRDPNTHA